MKHVRIVFLSTFCAVIGLVGNTRAQPADSTADKKGDAARPPATSGEDPAAPRPAEKPPGTEPRPAGPLPGATDTAPPKPADAKPKALYGVGVDYQFLIVPQFFLRAFLIAARNESHNLYRHAGGLHFVRRKGSLDIIVRVMFGRFMDKSDDGNWLGKGHDWDELDYTEFHNLDFLWADVSFIYHWKLAKNFYFGLGGGIGLGVVFGDVYTTESYVGGVAPNACDRGNYSNCSTCHPFNAVCTSSSCDRASLQTNNDREKSKSVPPVLPALNGVLSLRYDIWRHLSARFNTGIYLPGLFVFQFGIEWVF